MSEVKLIQGPWVVLESRDVLPAVISPGLAIICMDVVDADHARLIAAAPDLLEALRPFAAFACDEPHVNEPLCQNCIARAAIARATKGSE